MKMCKFSIWMQVTTAYRCAQIVGISSDKIKIVNGWENRKRAIIRRRTADNELLTLMPI